MGRCRLLRLPLMMLFSLSWMIFVDVGRSFADVATPRNFRDIFVGRCEEYHQHSAFRHWIDTYVLRCNIVIIVIIIAILLTEESLASAVSWLGGQRGPFAFVKLKAF